MAFKKTLQLCIRKINEDGGQHSFPVLHKHIASNNIVISQNILAVLKEHLLKLAKYESESQYQEIRILDTFPAQSSIRLRPKFADSDLVEF